jgi:DNA-binding response OmpR family regulator
MNDILVGRILVVDDYSNWRTLLKSILEIDGHQVVTASTHAEAEEKLREGAFDAVILDMRLVDEETYNVQGIALLREIRCQSPFTGAVILTGYPDSLSEYRALSVYGADAYLHKVPDEADFDIEAFSELVAALVRRSRNARQQRLGKAR